MLLYKYVDFVHYLRLQHHQFEAETRMYFNPQCVDEKAGLLLFKDEFHQYFMAVAESEAGRTVSLIQIGREEDSVLACEKVSSESTCFDLKIVSTTGLTFDFLYSVNGGKTWNKLCEKVDAGYLSTAVAGGFTGTTIALYATRK